MAIARDWRSPRRVQGPLQARLEQIAPLNQVFSDAFTDRYRRDGMVGVRVPFLNPAIWRYAIQDADAGAMIWRGERGEIAAFNLVHRSGREGWMGPLAVHTGYQGAGLGREVVEKGIEWLRSEGASVIGLETMPRTMDNIGFYSALGFVPGHLTVTLTIDATSSSVAPTELLGRVPSGEREAALQECRELTDTLMPGYDYTRELELTEQLALGDTLLLRSDGRLAGYALCHTAPLVEGRVREELRVLKMVLARRESLDAMLASLGDFARRSGTRRVAIRVQGEYGWMYRRLVEMRARVRWTDLRMHLNGHAEPVPERGAVLSNWEI
jgi:GNAT superfamily N-acetyltransferase